MGVDWKTCNYCGKTFPDCGDYVYCYGCDTEWCSLECAEAEGYTELDEDNYPDLDEEERCSCKWCCNEDVEDSELLIFAGELLVLSREELVSKYIKENNKN